MFYLILKTKSPPLHSLPARFCETHFLWWMVAIDQWLLHDILSADCKWWTSEVCKTGETTVVSVVSAETLMWPPQKQLTLWKKWNICRFKESIKYSIKCRKQDHRWSWLVKCAIFFLLPRYYVRTGNLRKEEPRSYEVFRTMNDIPVLHENKINAIKSCVQVKFHVPNALGAQKLTRFVRYTEGFVYQG